MPRSRYRQDDEWSNDSDYDDYRIREVQKRISRSHSRHDRRSPREEPTINYFENKLYVPGQEGRPSRSRSRHRSSSDERDRERARTERLLAELALGKLEHTRSDESRHYEEDRYRHEEDMRRRLELDMREEKAKDESRRKRLEWDLEEARRDDERKRKELQRDIEDAKRKQAEESEKAIREAADKAKADEEKKQKQIAQWKADEEAKKKKAKEEAERIILEAELEKKEKEKEKEETKKRILAEHALELEKEKLKKKEEDEKFEARIRERAIKAGLDPDKAVRQLRGRSPSGNRETGMVRHTHTGFRRRVKVRRDHILPQTLDSYKLRWNYSDTDSNIIIIEDEIDDDFLYELQVDSERIIKSRKLITPGYKKETITTLTPGGSNESVRKKGGKMYMVRKRSVSRNRHPSLSDLY